MKKAVIFVVVLIAAAAGGYFMLSGPREIVVADFNSGEMKNNVGAAIGTWDKDPKDKTQGCKMEYAEPGRDEQGKCVKIICDVDSPNPAYNGFYVKLDGVDASKCKKLSFWIKGDKAAYPERFKLELKSEAGVSSVFIEGYADVWQEISFPLTEFSLIKDFNKMKEFVIVFEDSQLMQKTGAIYIDDIKFAK